MELGKLKKILHQRASKLGFDDFRVTTVDSIPAVQKNLREFIANNFHGEMEWLANRVEERTSPRKLWTGARSVILVALNYSPEIDPLSNISKKNIGNISVYARNRDYHSIIKGRLKEIAGILVSNGGGDAKVFVDTAPVMEKPLAEAAGVGWQGKHTNLVSRNIGSWFFLGAIFSSLNIPVDAPETDHCGKCRACLDICPTKAFPSPYQIDARRCISYLTIEHHGPIPHEFRKAIGNRIYGCDDCLAVCPWNKFARSSSELKLMARDDLISPPLAELLELTNSEFQTLFSGSAIKRIGRDRFIRNVLIAVGNSGNNSYCQQVLKLLEDSSELVRGAAVWALGELLNKSKISELAPKYLPSEKSQSVLDEWKFVQQIEG